MVPTDTVFARMLALLGADTLTVGTTATPTACTVALVKATFSPGPTLRLADIVEADFDGYAAKTVASAPQPQSNDPSNGDSILLIPPLAGGFNWETTGLTNLPQVIYGYVVIGHGPEIVGSALISPPINLTGVNQGISIPSPTFRQVNGTVV